jgi:hypothetical protein
MTDDALAHAPDSMTIAPEPPRPAAWRRMLPWLAMAALVAWQSAYLSASFESRERFAMRASMGLSPDITEYFYFYYHFGQFPVGAREAPRLGPTHADAQAFVVRHGRRLRMDFGVPVNTPRFGDYGKLFLFYPDVWWHHDPGRPSARPFNEVVFLLALLATLAAFWREGHALMGVVIVLLVGSDPFQVLETYGRGNIFSLPISVMLLALATNLRLLTGRCRIDRTTWIVAIGSGVLLASIREMRLEAALAALSLLVTYALVRRETGRRRALLVFAFAAALAVTSFAWQRYWEGRFEAAKAFVAHAGGQVFREARPGHHALWHAMWCGLGDFGGDRGFTWDDTEAFRWATTRDPATNPRPLPYHYRNGYYFEETWDGIHRIAPTDLDAYNTLVRRRVLGVIAAHPLWYARVLGQRAWAILGTATPASLAYGARSATIPGTGWLLVPLVALFVWRRRWLYLALTLFSLPLALPPLAVYSGRGMVFYGIAHLVAIACVIEMLARPRVARPRTA